MKLHLWFGVVVAVVLVTTSGLLSCSHRRPTEPPSEGVANGGALSSTGGPRLLLVMR